MQATANIDRAAYNRRMTKFQDALREMNLRAAVMESGAGMTYLTGVRWGRSERTFALVVPASGEAAWVLPGFEEERARELIPSGSDIRVWQEDESPYAQIAAALKDRGVTTGRVAVEDAVRFFVFDGIRKAAPKLSYVSARGALSRAGVESPPAAGR